MCELSLSDKSIEANETVILEERHKSLDMNRLLDSTDSYRSIMYSSKRQILLRDGEYVFAEPKPSEIVLDLSTENEDYGLIA